MNQRNSRSRLTGVEGSNRVFVDQQADCLTNLCVLQIFFRVAVGSGVVVKCEATGRKCADHNALDISILTCNVVGDGLVSNNLTGRNVDIAGDDGCNGSVIATSGVADKLCILDAGRLTPVTIISGNSEIIRELDLVDHIRSGANGFGPVLSSIHIRPCNAFQQMLRKDHNTGSRIQEQGGRLSQFNGNDVTFGSNTGNRVCFTVHSFLLAYNILAECKTAAVRIQHGVIEGEYNVIRCQRLAVLPGDTLANGKSELRIVVIVRPLGCQRGNKLIVLGIIVCQRLKHHIRVQGLNILVRVFKYSVNTNRLLPRQLQGSFTLRGYGFGSLLGFSGGGGGIGRSFGGFGCLCATSHNAQNHDQDQKQSDDFFHLGSS